MRFLCKEKVEKKKLRICYDKKRTDLLRVHGFALEVWTFLLEYFCYINTLEFITY